MNTIEVAQTNAPINRFRTAPLRCLVLRLRLSLARRGKQPLTGRVENHDPCVADVIAVFGLAAFDGDRIADLESVSSPAHPHQAVGTAHLPSPVDDLAVRTSDVEIEIRVGILPLDFR